MLTSLLFVAIKEKTLKIDEKSQSRRSKNSYLLRDLMNVNGISEKNDNIKNDKRNKAERSLDSILFETFLGLRCGIFFE